MTAARGYKGSHKGSDLAIPRPITPYTVLQGGILLHMVQRKSDSTIISGLSLVDEVTMISQNSFIQYGVVIP